MHPSAQDLMAFEDGELTASTHRLVREHLAACPPCRMQVDHWHAEERHTRRLLSALDHRAPMVSVDAVIARANRPSRTEWRQVLAAGVTLTLLAGVATAAVPGSALRRYLDRHIAATTFPVPTRVRTVPNGARAPESAASGIGFVPAAAIDIAFHHMQSAGTIRIMLRDTLAVRVEHSSGSAGYLLTSTGVEIENAGSRASYTLVLPRSATRISVRVGNRTIFTRTADGITTIAADDRSGAYVVTFTHLNERTP